MNTTEHIRTAGSGVLMLVLALILPGCEPGPKASAAKSPPAVKTPASTPAKPAAEPAKPDAAAAKTAEPAKTAPEPAPAASAPKTETPATSVSEVPLGLPPLPVPSDNPITPEKVGLGKMLYFDKRVSKDGSVSCATCHDPKMAWAEHTPTSTGIHKQVGDRNSPTVINAAYASAQFWDGRAATLEEQATGPVENSIEMGHSMEAVVKQLSSIPEYEKRFQKVFGTGVTKEGFAKAIATFERTVLSGDSPYDRFVKGDKSALSAAQQRGLDLFKDNCAVCHTPPLFSNYQYYNAGVGMDKPKPDEGRKKVTGKDRDLGKFRVPSLREVANTAPYFHDGSAKTLEEAVALMANGGKDNPNLAVQLKALREAKLGEQDRKDLVDLLKALSGKYPIVEPPALP